MFSILEHADEGGRVEGLPAAAISNNRPAQVKSRPGQQQAPKKQAPPRQTAGSRPASAQQQTSRAEDYYRAFEHVFRDASSGVSLNMPLQLGVVSTCFACTTAAEVPHSNSRPTRSSQVIGSSLQAHYSVCWVIQEQCVRQHTSPPPPHRAKCQHLVVFAGVDEVVLRFHKTKIVRIRPNGDMMLTSGGWPTATTGRHCTLLHSAPAQRHCARMQLALTLSLT